MVRIFSMVSSLGVLSILPFLIGSTYALEEPEQSAVAQYKFRLSELSIPGKFRLPSELPVQFAFSTKANIKALGLPANAGRIDVRSGRWASLILAEPMVPGHGRGNGLDWAKLGHDTPRNDSELGSFALRTFREFIEAANQEFRIDSAEITDPGKATVHNNGSLIQIHIPRVFQGVPVRDSYLTATISHGNLALFGTHQWGDIHTSTVPWITASEAQAATRSFVSPFPVNATWSQTELVLLPVAKLQKSKSMQVGEGYDHRLAWVVRPAFDGDPERFEALVDAHTGEIISFEDTNHYVDILIQVSGGVLPVSNDGVGSDGTEQAGWPMPFDKVTAPVGVGEFTTDSGGNLRIPFGGTSAVTAESTLSGQYVRINDNCGPISLSSTGDIDFGSSPGTDCTTPGFGGAGNTHAARTSFYELNRMAEMARSHLPGNTWLRDEKIVVNTNIDGSCNAFYKGSSLEFLKSGNGCANTGEIASVLDHEWAHGLDDNDANPRIDSTSGEGVADIFAALRLNSSCIGRNFFATNCSGFGDACLDCTGVRDIDYLKRVSGNPHDFTWSNSNCGTPHCRAAVHSEAVWSLWKRKLQAAPYNLDDQTAHEIVTRLTYIGGGNAGTWFSGDPPSGGCAATSGYMNFLMADDDNGDLSDGTPHMTAIYDAFNDQQIACETPTVQDSGCNDAPVNAPAVSGSGLHNAVRLNWGAVADVSAYDVFRTDGVHGCDFGKAKVGSTTGTSLIDTGLQNGRDYSYIVIPMGSSAACFGLASSCVTVAPTDAINLAVDPDNSTHTTHTGDSDAFVDNCEQATLTFDVYTTGPGSHTNVRITGVKSVSHPGTIVTSTFPQTVSPSSLFPVPPLFPIAIGSGSFNFTAARLPQGADLVFEVSFTSNELGSIKTEQLTITNTESDLQDTSIVADTQSNACPNDNVDTDGDGLTNIEEFDINPLLDPNNPDTDSDGIQDNIDNQPLVSSNFCKKNKAKISSEVISVARQCAAETSVTIRGTTDVTSTGSLEVISPILSIEPGFSVSGIFNMIPTDPCPACP